MSNGSWERRLYEVDPLALAMRTIESTYGDKVSVYEKGKSLLKFGKHLDLNTADGTETVWTLGSRAGAGNETYTTTNSIDTISSSSTSDTQSITIEGHTVSGTGTDSQFTFVIQTATLNGQNKVTLGTPLARVSRAYNTGTTAFVGDIFVYEDTAITTGVPDDFTKAHLEIRGTIGDTQSFKAATTFSNTDYFICTGGFVSIRRAQSASADFTLEVRGAGSVFRPVARINTNSNGTGAAQINLLPYAVVPKNADVRIRCAVTGNSVEVDGAFQGWIASIDNE